MITGIKENSFNLKVKLELKDCNQFAFQMTYSNPAIKSYTFLGLFLLVCTPIMFWQVLSKGGSIPVPIYCLAGGFILFVFLMPLTAKSFAKKMVSLNKFYQEEQNYFLGNEGIEVKTDSTMKKIMWNEIFKVRELKDSFVILPSITIDSAFIFPKRLFDSETQMKDFKDFLVKNIEPKKLKLQK